MKITPFVLLALAFSSFAMTIDKDPLVPLPDDDKKIKTEYRYKFFVSEDGVQSADTVSVGYKEYDENGNLTLHRDYSQGELYSTHTYSYSKKNQLKSSTITYASGNEVSVSYTLNEAGDPIEEIAGETKTQHYYNSAGFLKISLYCSLDDSLVSRFDEYEYVDGKLLWTRKYKLKPAYRRVTRANGGFGLKAFKKSKKYIEASPYIYFKQEYNEEGTAVVKSHWFGNITPDFAVHHHFYENGREVKKEYYTRQGVYTAIELVEYTYY